MGWLVVLASACSLALGIYVIVRHQMTRPGLAVVASGWLLLAVPCLTATERPVVIDRTALPAADLLNQEQEKIHQLADKLVLTRKLSDGL